jgi:hypothetical protein
MSNLADLLFDAIVNLDPKEFDAVAGAVARLRTASALVPDGCEEFATLFGAIERATAGVTDG